MQTKTLRLNLSDIGENLHDNMKYEYFVFHGGEPHIKLHPVKDVDKLIISARVNNSEDLMKIVLANDAARRLGISKIDLYMPYFPGARQDRVCNTGEPLTVKLYAEIINSCKFDNVFIVTPHSEVAPALINNVKIVEVESTILSSIVSENLARVGKTRVNIVCPDAGAGKRVQKLAKTLSEDGFIGKKLDVRFIRCEKVRDVSTGAITEFFVADNDLDQGVTIICDDILSMGGTFVGLGEQLRKRNCGKLILFVVHADCQAGIDKMTSFFDSVYVTNSKQDWKSNDKLITTNIFNLLY